jgi:hypothetical protein
MDSLPVAAPLLLVQVVLGRNFDLAPRPEHPPRRYPQLRRKRQERTTSCAANLA